MHSDPLLIESICIRDGHIPLIDYHNQRANRARRDLFLCEDIIDLSDYIDTRQSRTEVSKCRIVYDQYIRSIQYHAYDIRPITSIQLVDVDSDYTYAYKYVDRSELHHYYEQRRDKDDVLMVRDELITDTYYGNVALSKGDVWYTPTRPLLKGTQRESLLDKGLLIEDHIAADTVQSYDRIRIFNAMIGFGEIDLSIDCISPVR